MGVGGIGIWQLLIILAIVIMLFGTKRLRTLGSDMGAAIKGFRNTMTQTGEEQSSEADADADAAQASPEEKAETK